MRASLSQGSDQDVLPACCYGGLGQAICTHCPRGLRLQQGTTRLVLNLHSNSVAVEAPSANRSQVRAVGLIQSCPLSDNKTRAMHLDLEKFTVFITVQMQSQGH